MSNTRPTPIYDIACNARDNASDALAMLNGEIKRLQPEVEAAREASLLAEKDASITDDAFDVVDGAYLALRRRLEALEAMQVTALECCDQLGSVADAARVAGV